MNEGQNKQCIRKEMETNNNKNFSGLWNCVSGYHADTPITIKAEASSKADSRPN